MLKVIRRGKVDDIRDLSAREDRSLQDWVAPATPNQPN
jgi:hypothetical protein